MSVCDPYVEFELYLKKANDEITKVFEQSCAISLSDKEKIIPDHHQDEWNGNSVIYADATSKEDDGALEGSYLKDETIQYLTKDALYYDDALIESKYLLNGCIYHNCKLHSLLSPTSTESGSTNTTGTQTSILLSPLSTESSSTSTTGTQTSPVHDPMNLLSWSERSSPCIGSTDQEILDDSISLSSADGLENQWIRVKYPAWPTELAVKSSSTPILKRAVHKVDKQARSQSDRHLSEIEATEACKWLRKTGFPQYAQMYEDQQFPVDIAAVEQDHPKLETSVLNSLFRRLQALNRCARVHQQHVTHTDDSEDEQCALSENWEYQSDIRRWSRINPMDLPDNLGKAECDDRDAEPSNSDSTREALRRIGTSIYRRRNRDGMIMPDTGTNVLDFLSKQLGSLSTADSSPVHGPVSEGTSQLTKKKKTRSLEKTDTWTPYSPSHTERFTWKIMKNMSTMEDESINLEEGGRSIKSLSCTQLQVLRKLALLKLTAIMERYCPTHRSGWNWDLPKLLKKIKSPAYREKNVFGVPLTVVLQKTGLCLPKGIEDALYWLQQNAYDQVGLFRKSGVKSRIQNLKTMIETQRADVNFTEFQAYDIADMIKQYFRELPEALLTNKLSETFILIFQYVPAEERRQALLCALLLMPDEHCEALFSLLQFLKNIAEHSVANHMNESNLALCFAPSLFHYANIPTSRQGLGSPHPRELAENKAAHDCLLYLLENCETVYSIPKEILQQCSSNEMKETVAVRLSELGSDIGGWKEYLKECQNMLLREVREKGWIVVPNFHPRVELAYKKVADGHPLRLWKISAEIEAPPGEVLYRIIKERSKWDEELHSTRTIALIDKNAEVFQYTCRNLSSLPLEDYCVVRTWRTDLPKGACLIVETSIEHPDASNIPNSTRGIVLASRYLIEHFGSGKSKLLHLSRVDTRGRMPEWYHKNYGHICALHVSNIQNSFKQFTAGPESKV